MTNVDAVYAVRDRFGSKASAKISKDGATKAIFLDYPRKLIGFGATWEEAIAMTVANRLLGNRLLGKQEEL